MIFKYYGEASFLFDHHKKVRLMTSLNRNEHSSKEINSYNRSQLQKCVHRAQSEPSFVRVKNISLTVWPNENYHYRY